MILNIQMQLHNQNDDGKYCVSFILFDLLDQSDVKASESTMQGKFIRRQQNKSHSTYQHALARHTPFHLHCPCPGDFPLDANHWSVAVTVQWERETVCLCWTHPAHLVLGCRCIWLNISEVTGQGMLPDLFWPPALLHEKRGLISCLKWECR